MKNIFQMKRNTGLTVTPLFNHGGLSDCTEVAESSMYYGCSENELATMTIGCAIEVHRRLGPVLLESAYAKCLTYELISKGLEVETEKPLPLVYKEIKMEIGYRLDILVENKLIVEVKSVEAINDVHIAQCLTYLKVSDRKLALLINFNTTLLKKGIKRLINGQLISGAFVQAEGQ